MNFIVCAEWKNRSGLMPRVKVVCSICQAECALDRGNVSLGFTPVCLTCAAGHMRGTEISGGAVNGKILPLRDAVVACVREIVSRN